MSSPWRAAICDICIDDDIRKTATHGCVACKKNFCENCNRFHGMFEKTHTVTSDFVESVSRAGSEFVPLLPELIPEPIIPEPEPVPIQMDFPLGSLHDCFPSNILPEHSATQYVNKMVIYNDMLYALETIPKRIRVVDCNHETVKLIPLPYEMGNDMVITSNGDILVTFDQQCFFIVFDQEGNEKAKVSPECSIPNTKNKFFIARDENDNIYFTSKIGSHVFIFDRDYVQKGFFTVLAHGTTISIEENKAGSSVVLSKIDSVVSSLTIGCIAVDKRGNIVICHRSGGISVFNRMGMLKRHFERKEWTYFWGVCFDENNNYIAADYERDTLYVFTEDGRFVRNIYYSGNKMTFSDSEGWKYPPGKKFARPFSCVIFREKLYISQGMKSDPITYIPVVNGYY